MSHNPNVNYMYPFWELRIAECQRGLEVAVARLALSQHPGQLSLLSETESPQLTESQDLEIVENPGHQSGCHASPDVRAA